MNLFTACLHIVGSGASAFITARNMRDAQTRPNLLAGLQLAESGSVPFLEQLQTRAIAEGDAWLADKLARHAQDERKHGKIFALALKRLNKQAIDPATLAAQDADSSKRRQRSPFLAAYFEGYTKADLSPEAIEWPVFFASTYILELDASKDFLRMAQVLPEDDLVNMTLKQGLISIAADEQRHAAYLFEAMTRRMPYSQVQQLVSQWRSRKVNAMLAMVGNLIQRNGQMNTLVQEGAPTDLEDEVLSVAS